MKYRVEVVQTNVFYIEADSKERAREIATEDYIWDEAQTAPDTYGVHFHIEEQEDQDNRENDVYYNDGKPVYNHKPIDNDSIEPNKECSQCDVEYTCFDCEAEQIRERYPEVRYTDHLEWIVPDGTK